MINSHKLTKFILKQFFRKIVDEWFLCFLFLNVHKLRNNVFWGYTSFIEIYPHTRPPVSSIHCKAWVF